MYTRAGRQLDHLPEDLVVVEHYLDTHLQPVEPRPAYVTDLKQRLMHPESLSEPKASNTDLVLFGGVALLASVLALLLGYKAAVALLGGLGLLDQMKKHFPRRGENLDRPAAGELAAS